MKKKISFQHLEQRKEKILTTQNINQKLKTILKYTSHPIKQKLQPVKVTILLSIKKKKQHKS